jgi:hypothetical protein
MQHGRAVFTESLDTNLGGAMSTVATSHIRQIHGALAHYYDHQAELDAQISAQEEEAGGFVSRPPTRRS